MIRTCWKVLIKFTNMSFFATTALPKFGCSQNADNDIDGYPINFDIEERNYISPQLAVALVENKLTKKQWHCFHCQSLMKKCNITKQYICVVCNHLDKNYDTNINSENGFYYGQCQVCYNIGPADHNCANCFLGCKEDSFSAMIMLKNAYEDGAVPMSDKMASEMYNFLFACKEQGSEVDIWSKSQWVSSTKYRGQYFNPAVSDYKYQGSFSCISDDCHYRKRQVQPYCIMCYQSKMSVFKTNKLSRQYQIMNGGDDLPYLTTHRLIEKVSGKEVVKPKIKYI